MTPNRQQQLMLGRVSPTVAALLTPPEEPAKAGSGRELAFVLLFSRLSAATP